MHKFSQNLEIEDANKLCAIKNDYHNFSNLRFRWLGVNHISIALPGIVLTTKIAFDS